MRNDGPRRPESVRPEVKLRKTGTPQKTLPATKAKRPEVKAAVVPMGTAYIPINDSFSDIEITNDLSIFKLMEGGNRPLDWNFIQKKLLDSIRESGFDKLQPITVFETSDGRYAVVDGQHRLEACRLLKAAISYRVINPHDVDEFLKKANCTRDWTTADWLNHYADPKSPNFKKPYAELKALAADANLSLNTIIYICRVIARQDKEFADYFNGKVADIIYRGLFTFPLGMKEKLIVILMLFKEIMTFLPRSMRSKEICKKAFIQVMLHKRYNHKRMQTALHRRAGDLRPSSKLSLYREQILNMYNGYLTKRDQIIDPNDFESREDEKAAEAS